MRRIWTSIVFFSVLCYSTLALAQPAEPDVGSTVDQIVAAASAGKWLLVVAGVLTVVMLLLRGARDRIKLFRGDRGGAVLLLLLALLGSLATFFASEGGISWKALVGALVVAFTSSGGYNTIRRIVWPQDLPATAPTEENP